MAACLFVCKHQKNKTMPSNPLPGIQTPTPPTNTVSPSKSGTPFILHTMEDDLAALKPQGSVATAAIPPKPTPSPVSTLPKPAAPEQKPATESIRITATKPATKPSLEELFGSPKSPAVPAQPVRAFEPSSPTPPQLATPVSPIQIPDPKTIPPKPAFDPFAQAKEDRRTPAMPTASFQLPRWIIPTGIGIFTFLMVGGGFWYWKHTTTSVTPNPEEEVLPPIQETPVTPIEPPIETPPPAPVLPFDLQKPNDLSISLTASPDAFRATLLSASQKIKEATTIQQSVEFRVVDEKGAPVPFAAWSTWLKLSLPSTLLATFDTPFSLFLFNDQGYMRIGLKVTSKNPSQTKMLLAKNESTLLKNILPLYLGTAPTLPKTPVKFTTGNYKSIPTRYFNFAVPEAPFIGGLSLDYVSLNQFIIFGTSKQSTRAILDTLNPTSNQE